MGLNASGHLRFFTSLPSNFSLKKRGQQLKRMYSAIPEAVKESLLCFFFCDCSKFLSRHQCSIVAASFRNDREFTIVDYCMYFDYCLKTLPIKMNVRRQLSLDFSDITKFRSQGWIN